MAKRRRLRSNKMNPDPSHDPFSPGDNSTSAPRHWQSRTLLHPTHRPISRSEKRVLQSHKKHSSPLPSSSSLSSSSPDPPRPLTLGDRFASLPPELRAQVFSHLVVRPPKWTLSHLPTCTLAHPIPWTSNCANCTSHYSASFDWTLSSGPIVPHPSRSVWAPPQANPYLCTRCYDERWRPRPFPRPSEAQRCLCARRRDLQTLLVCRDWYAEAGEVFYSQNTLAFEDPCLLARFVESLAPRWRVLVSRLSLLMAPGRDVEVRGAAVTEAWGALRSLAGLSLLELDARFLGRERTVRGMVKMGLRNLRAVRFVKGRRAEGWSTSNIGDGVIWTRWCETTLLEGGLAGEVARSIKGQRRKWMKKHAAVERAVRAVREELCMSDADDSDDSDFGSHPFN